MIINLLLGLAVFGTVALLWFIAETFPWGENFIAVLMLLILAYGVGGILRWAF